MRDARAEVRAEARKRSCQAGGRLAERAFCAQPTSLESQWLALPVALEKVEAGWSQILRIRVVHARRLQAPQPVLGWIGT